LISPDFDRLSQLCNQSGVCQLSERERAESVRAYDHMTNDADDFSLLLGADVPTREYKAGAIVFREGEHGTEFYVIQKGRVQILSGNRVLETLGGSEIFGEMALIDASPRSATVVAETDVVVAPITEKQYLFLVRHTPYFALKVMRVLAERLRAQNRAV
jgi:CRP/FNR family transcriptional regulator, cyclic AMP receptor protein